VSPLLRRSGLRVEHLADDARPEFTRLVDADPIVNAVIGARLRQVSTLSAQAFGGDVLAVRDPDDRLVAAAVHGRNLLPVGGTEDDWQVLADHLARRPRPAISIVGRAQAVHTMWQLLEPRWGPARALRPRQPLLVLDRAGNPRQCDPHVRAVRPDQLDVYLPAAAAMFTEELGVSPEAAAGMGDYRQRVAAAIRDGRAFARFGPDGAVTFKADLGAVSAHTCQVHGVWVRPDLRGRGIGAPALAAVVQHALTLAPTVSLYVNDFNTAARRVYERLGMRQVAELSTVLF
jgi:hypothetical protein